VALIVHSCSLMVEFLFEILTNFVHEDSAMSTDTDRTEPGQRDSGHTDMN